MYDPDFSSPTPSKIKRSRGGLGLTARQKKYLIPKQTGYYLEKRGLEFPSTEQISARITRNREAVLASWYKDVDLLNPPDFSYYENKYNLLGKLQPGMIEVRILKRKIKARQRIASHKKNTVHSDAQEAFDNLIKK